MTDEGDGVPSRCLIFLRAKTATQHGFGSETGEKFAAHRGARREVRLQPGPGGKPEDRIAAPGQHHASRDDGRHASKLCARFRSSSKSGFVIGSTWLDCVTDVIRTTRSVSGTRRGRSRKELTRLKTDAVEPIPSDRDNKTANVTARVFRIDRNAERKSCKNDVMPRLIVSTLPKVKARCGDCWNRWTGL